MDCGEQLFSANTGRPADTFDEWISGLLVGTFNPPHLGTSDYRASRMKMGESYTTNDDGTEFIKTSGDAEIDYRTDGSPTVSIRARAFAGPAST